MKTMNVMRFNDNSSAPALIAGTAPVPTPGNGEILVRIHAAGVTPTELLWYPTTHTRAGTPRSGAIPGHEFSGVIEAVGTGLDAGMVGREVFGMNDWFSDGATAEYCLAAATSITPKRAHLSHAEAASVPIGALTAWQGLLDRAKLQAGERVLIHGGSGAVGVFAIQLAHSRGAHVIATASPRNFDFLSKLGADDLIDYHTGNFEESARNVDVVFDTVGGETLRRSWNVLKPNGRLVTIAASSEGQKDERTEKAFFIVEPNREQLDEIADRLEAGLFHCAVDAVLPFARAADAYGGKIEKGQGRGKVVISLAE